MSASPYNTNYAKTFTIALTTSCSKAIVTVTQAGYDDCTLTATTGSVSTLLDTAYILNHGGTTYARRKSFLIEGTLSSSTSITISLNQTQCYDHGVVVDVIQI